MTDEEHDQDERKAGGVFITYITKDGNEKTVTLMEEVHRLLSGNLEPDEIIRVNEERARVGMAPLDSN